MNEGAKNEQKTTGIRISGQFKVINGENKRIPVHVEINNTF